MPLLFSSSFFHFHPFLFRCYIQKDQVCLSLALLILYYSAYDVIRMYQKAETIPLRSPLSQCFNPFRARFALAVMFFHFFLDFSFPFLFLFQPSCSLVSLLALFCSFISVHSFLCFHTLLSSRKPQLCYMYQANNEHFLEQITFRGSGI